MNTKKFLTRFSLLFIILILFSLFMVKNLVSNKQVSAATSTSEITSIDTWVSDDNKYIYNTLHLSDSFSGSTKFYAMLFATTTEVPRSGSSNLVTDQTVLDFYNSYCSYYATSWADELDDGSYYFYWQDFNDDKEERVKTVDLAVGTYQFILQDSKGRNYYAGTIYKKAVFNTCLETSTQTCFVKNTTFNTVKRPVNNNYIFVSYTNNENTHTYVNNKGEILSTYSSEFLASTTIYCQWTAKNIQSFELKANDDTHYIYTIPEIVGSYGTSTTHKIYLFSDKSDIESYTITAATYFDDICNDCGKYSYFASYSGNVADDGSYFYEWRNFKDAKDNMVDVDEIGTGTYQVVIVDQYNCCHYVGTIYKKNITDNVSSSTKVGHVVYVADTKQVNIPTLTNYVFRNYSNTQNTNVYVDTNGKFVSSNFEEFKNATTVYLAWGKTYQIHFDGNGATSGEMTNLTHALYTDTTKIALTNNSFTKTGYKFIGWSQNKSDTTATYTNGESILPLSSTAGDTITLYAIWEILSFNIKAKINNGLVTEKIYTFKYGEKIVIDYTHSDYIQTGYTFKGWNTTLPDTMPANDITVTAVWEATLYKLSLYLDSEKTELYKERTYTYLDTIDTTWFADPVKEGYTFKGWNETFRQTMLDYDLSYYALWEKNSYVLTYELVEGEKEVHNCLYDEALPTPQTYTYLKGYLFIKWNETIPEKMPAHDVTITSSWKEAIFTLTCVLGEGLENKVYLVKYDATLADILETPTKAHYTFDGWEETDLEKMPLNDLTIHAKWKINTHKVLFYDVDEGKTVTQNYEYGATINPPTPKKAHYTFVSWNASIPETMPDYDLEYQPVWKIASYKIYFDTDGGSPIDEITFEYNQDIIFNVTTTKNGFDFVSWDQEIPSKMPDHDITLKALWKERKYTVSYYVDEVLFHQESYEKGDTIVLLAQKPEKEGYNFVGWDTGLPQIMDGVDYVLKACFEMQTFLVHFESNSPTLYIDQTISYGGKVEKVEDPVKGGYIFKGWYSDSELQTAYDFDQLVFAPLTLYASYEKIITTNHIETSSNDLGVSITFSEKVSQDVKLKIRIVSNEDLDDAAAIETFLIDYSRYMSDTSILAAVYDLSLTLDGKEVSYDGMEIQLEVPSNIKGKELVLYHVTSDEDFEEITNFEYVDGVILLKCNELKEFALFYYLVDEPVDNSKLYMIIAIASAAIVVAGLSVIIIRKSIKRKRNKQKKAWLDDF